MSEARPLTEDYHLERLLRSGPTGSVFRAVDQRSGETVAVKLLHGVDEASAADRERFLAASRALQALDHPSLPRLLDFGFSPGGGAFLVSEFIAGTSLDTEAGGSTPRLLSLLLTVVDGLDALSSRDLTHGDLRAENLVVVATEEGEQVKFLGLGHATAGAGEEERRRDLRALAELACRLLGATFDRDVTSPQVELPHGAAAEVEDPATLRSLLETLLARDAPVPPYSAVRQVLRRARGMEPPRRPVPTPPPPPPAKPAADRLSETGTMRLDRDRLRAGTLPVGYGAPAGDLRGEMELAAVAPPVPVASVALPDWEKTRPVYIPAPPPAPPEREHPGDITIAHPPGELPFTPPPPPAPSPPAPPTAASPVATLAPAVTAATAPASRPSHGPRRSRDLWLAAAVAAVTVLGVAGALAARFFKGSPAAPSAPPSAPARVAPVAAPPPAPVAAPAPPAVQPQIGAAEAALAAGDLEAARQALAALSPEVLATLSAEEQARYREAQARLGPPPQEQLAARLAAALKQGNVAALRPVVAGLPAGVEATLAPEAHRNLQRARKLLELDRALARAEKTADREATLRAAAALLKELPREERAAALRERTAAAIEGEADAAAAGAQWSAALELLAPLRRAWPERPGLAGRLERAEGELQEEQRLTAVLAAASRAEERNDPFEGLKTLDGARPNSRFAERFRQERGRLRELAQRLDGASPSVRLGEGARREYTKGKAFKIPLRISDDYRVESSEAWVRPEGGRYTQVPIRAVAGDSYEIEIAPDLHQDRTVEIYVVAADVSGHRGQLGSAERPERFKRRGFFSNLLRGDEKP